MSTREPGGSPAMLVGGWGATPHPGVYASLFLVSMGVMTLEVSLTRFFSFTVWYHFAYLTISVALLGFGASGAMVAAFPQVFGRLGHGLLVAMTAAAAAITVAAIALLARFPLELADVLFRPARFSVVLLGYYVAVGAPFLLAGFAITLPFAAYPRLMGRLYFWDLLGAACGCLAAVQLVEIMTVPGLVVAAAGLILAGGASLNAGVGRPRLAAALGALALLLTGIAKPMGHVLPIRVTGTKQPATYPGPGDPGAAGAADVYAADAYTKWTALNRVDAAGWEAPTTAQFWASTGLMPGYAGPRPSVGRVTYDGCNGSNIYPFGGTFDDYAMLEHHLLRTPYLLQRRPRVLVIGVGGGIDMLNAVYQGARHVTGVELQPETVYLLRDRLRGFTGGFYDRPDVRLVVGEGRHFIRKSTDTFDLIQITGVDTFAAQATGAYVLAESYLYTVDAVKDYLARLEKGGLVSLVVGDVIHGDELPPLATRLLLTGARALAELGAATPEHHLLCVGSKLRSAPMRSQNVLIKKAPFTAAEVRAVLDFAAAKGFETLYAPAPNADRSYPLSTAVGGAEDERRGLLRDAWFRLDPVYDRNPFFYNVAKWSNFSPTHRMVAYFPGSFVGQLVLVLMIAQSLLLGVALIVLPLLRGARHGLGVPRVMQYLAYFLALGVGFMFIEISFVQSFVLFLGSPTYALSVTIFALLLFSGVGSLCSMWFAGDPQRALAHLAVVIAVLIVLYSIGLNRVFAATLHLDVPLRILIAIVAQMPLGLVLGMFMPLGIACVADEHARLVPWAWGMNGIGSVVGTTLAVVLAMSWGFTTVAVSAAALYLAGTALLLRAARAACEGSSRGSRPVDSTWA